MTTPSSVALKLGYKATAALLVHANGVPVIPNPKSPTPFLSGLLHDDPYDILPRFEVHAQRASAAAGVGLFQLIKPERLLGAEKYFQDAFAELVALSWLSDAGVLEAPKQLAVSDTLSGKAHELDGVLSAGGPRSKQVLFDVKCLRPQARQAVDEIQEEISKRLAQTGVAGNLYIHVKGPLDAARITHESKKTLVENAVTKLQQRSARKNREFELGKLAGCTLMAQLRTRPPYRTAFYSGLEQVRVERKELWSKLKQLPCSRSFLLVLVRTYAGGLKHVGMSELLTNAHSLHRLPESIKRRLSHLTPPAP